MKKIAQLTELILENYPSYCEALGLGIANYSAMARLLRSEVEAKKMEGVSDEAIAIALKRLAPKMKEKLEADQSLQPIQGVNLRQDITILSYERSPHLLIKYQDLLQKLDGTDNAFMHLDQGVRDMSFIVSEEMVGTVKSLMKAEKHVATYEDCSLVSIMMPRKSLDYPGVCARYFRLLAWHYVNLLSFYHSHAQLTFVVESKDALKAQSLILRMHEQKY